MALTDVRKDPTALTMTVASEWDAPIERVWQLWADPRKLERWWGPPTYPATVVEHDLRPGGKVTYFMTGPEGARHHGWWKVVAVEEPHRLELEDGFADAKGNPDDAMPTTQFTVTFAELPGGSTRMTIDTRFPSRPAMGQIGAILATA
jgi:uncharacterized protein YndB with AHSA1/START domain